MRHDVPMRSRRAVAVVAAVLAVAACGEGEDGFSDGYGALPSCPQVGELIPEDLGVCQDGPATRVDGRPYRALLDFSSPERLLVCRHGRRLVHFDYDVGVQRWGFVGARMVEGSLPGGVRDRYGCPYGPR